MIDNHQLGYPDGTMPEDQPNPRTDHQDIYLPPMEAYETLTEQIPASPLDNTTVAIDTARDVDPHDHAAYATEYTNRIIAATQAQFGNLTPDNIDQGPIPTQGPLNAPES